MTKTLSFCPSSYSVEREEENQFFAASTTSKIILATPPRPLLLPSSKPFEVGEVGDGCLASLQQTPRKMNTVGPDSRLSE